MNLGQKIRETREDRGISLRKLAKEIGVSPSFISQVEQSKAQPSVGSLKEIARVLEVNCSYLIGEEDSSAFITTSTKTKKNRFNTEKFHKVNIKKMVPENIDNHLEPTLLILDPGAYSEETSQDSGEEFLLLLAGELQISLNNKSYTLREGDNIYFNASVKHSFKNISNQPTKVLWVKGS